MQECRKAAAGERGGRSVGTRAERGILTRSAQFIVALPALPAASRGRQFDSEAVSRR